MQITALPFNQFVGIEMASEPGALLRLPSGERYLNHIGTVHASALLALAEASSGEYLLRRFGTNDGVLPLVRRLESKFRKPAHGAVRSAASALEEDLSRVQADLQSKGRAVVAVQVELHDESGAHVLSASVEWFIQRVPKETAEVTLADPESEPARQMVEQLCAELSAQYGTAPSPFAPSEAAGPKGAFVVAMLGADPIGCGALRPLDEATAELKRMYVAPAGRRRGTGRKILAALEEQAVNLGYRRIRLETGTKQTAAIALYASSGFQRIEPFGAYVGNPISVCFEKTLQC